MSRPEPQAYIYRLDPKVMNQLRASTRVWIAKAILNMVLIDGFLDEDEMKYVEQAARLVSDLPGASEKILECAEKHQMLQLGKMEEDREYAGEIIYFLATVIVADGVIMKSEVNYLKTLCNKLGFPDFVAKKMLIWIREAVRLNKDRELHLYHLRRSKIA